MKKGKRLLHLTVVVVALLLLSACANTEISRAVEATVREDYADGHEVIPVIPSPDELATMEDEVIRLLNEYRVENGLNELVKDEDLTYVARIRAEEIVTTWSHIRPDGTKYVDILDEMEYPSPLVGENLARGQATPARAMEMWKESPSHNENMLIPEYTKVGVGIYVTEDGKLHYVQIFAQ